MNIFRQEATYRGHSHRVCFYPRVNHSIFSSYTGNGLSQAIGTRRCHNFSNSYLLWHCRPAHIALLSLTLYCWGMNVSGAASQPMNWTLVEELRIGTIDSPNYSLTEVGGIAVGPDGSMYVAQPQERMIRVYDQTGRFVRSIGRAGGGPGEFESLFGLGWKGDTLWVNDFQRARMTMFSRDGRVLDVLDILGPRVPNLSVQPTHPIAMLNDGTVLGEILTGMPDGSPKPIARMTRSGELIELFGTVYQSILLRTHRPGAGIQMASPIADGSLLGFLPAESAVVLVHRRAPSNASRGTFAVEVLRSASDTAFHRRYEYQPRPVSRPARDSIIQFRTEAAVARASGNIPAPVMRELMNEALSALPEYQPPVTALVAGRDGTIWLRREDLQVDQVEWLVLDGRGAIIAWFYARPSLSIMQAQRDRIWGVEKDALGVSYIVQYRTHQ